MGTRMVGEWVYRKCQSVGTKVSNVYERTIILGQVTQKLLNYSQQPDIIFNIVAIRLSSII